MNGEGEAAMDETVRDDAASGSGMKRPAKRPFDESDYRQEKLTVETNDEILQHS